MYRYKKLPLSFPAIRATHDDWENNGVRVFKGVINAVGFSIVLYGLIAALWWTIVHYHLIHIHL